MIGIVPSHLSLVVSTEVTKAILLANLAQREVSLIGETGISIQMQMGRLTLFIPQPLMDNQYYTIGQLEEIEDSLGAFGIELLPIDYNLI